jgi:hypothetical protein
LKTVKLWTFDGSTELHAVQQDLPAPAGHLRDLADPRAFAQGPQRRAGSFAVLVRLTRTAPAPLGRASTLHPSHGEGIGFFGKPLSADPASARPPRSSMT